jgi:hypothetical protein
MWINDKELIDRLKQFTGVCIVVRKEKRGSAKWARLHEVNEQTPGLPARAFAALGGLEPRGDSEMSVIGGPMSDDFVVPTIRTIGFRHYGPIIHAKLAVLGVIRWHDEDALGHVADVIWFKPRRLWLSSANFTTRSRHSLEFGLWTEDEALLNGAYDFLVKLIRSSEGIDPESDLFEPDLGPIEFDEQYIAEFLSEMEWDEGAAG